MTTRLIVGVAGLLTAIGSTFGSLWFLAIAGMALFIYQLWFQTSTRKDALLLGSIYSLVVSGAGIIWFFDAYPLDWLGIHGALSQGLVLFLAWLVVSLSLTVGPALAALVLWHIRTSPYRIVIAAVLWILAEEARMWGFAFLTFSHASLIGPHFSIVSLGYVLANSPFLLQLATHGGLAALTFFAVLLSGSIAVVASGTIAVRERWLIAILLVGMLLLPLWYGLNKRDEVKTAPLSVVLVSTKDTADEPTHDTLQSSELVRKALNLYPRPDLVIFPENYAVSGEVALHKTDKENEVLFISSEKKIAESGGTYTVDLVYDSTSDGRLATYHKQFFMPLGEYAPTLSIPLFSLVQNESVNRYLKKLSGLTSKGEGFVTVEYKGQVVGGLLCSESISPYLYKQLAKQGATVLVNSANPAWFRGSSILNEKLIRIGRVQAVSNHAYYLQASNDLPSFALSPTGEMLASSSTDDVELLQVPLSR